jgi:hypothetical protein
MKIIIKLIIAVFLILNCDIKVLAQATIDSVSVTTEEARPPESLGDTVLNRYEFETDDSMEVYKGDKDFAYMKYLDSLLRKTKDLTVDTFSAETGSSKGKRKVRQTSGRVNVPQLNIFSDPVVKIVLWIAAIFLIGFIIYKVFVGENFFRRDSTYKNISDTEKEEEITDASAYDKLVMQAVANGNYRLAIRYLFLQTLQKLSGNGLLQFSADKTNYQYVNELQGKPYQNDFAALTLNYEYVWYGKFDISEAVYKRLAGDYKSFHQKI